MAKSEREKYKNNFVQYVLDRLKISRWDYLLIGDGSGTVRDKSCGWASVMIDRQNRRKVYSGRFNYGGSNIVAETMAYIQPIMDLAKHERAGLDCLRVHIISDCEHVVDAGNNPHKRRGQPVLWAPIQVAQNCGVITKWHWWRRDEIALNQLCHDLANIQRVATDDDAALDAALANVYGWDETSDRPQPTLRRCSRYIPE